MSPPHTVSSICLKILPALRNDVEEQIKSEEERDYPGQTRRMEASCSPFFPGQRVPSSDLSQSIILLHLALSTLDCSYLCTRLIFPTELQACGAQSLPLLP